MAETLLQVNRGWQKYGPQSSVCQHGLGYDILGPADVKPCRAVYDAIDDSLHLRGTITTVDATRIEGEAGALLVLCVFMKVQFVFQLFFLGFFSRFAATSALSWLCGDSLGIFCGPFPGDFVYFEVDLGSLRIVLVSFGIVSTSFWPFRCIFGAFQVIFGRLGATFPCQCQQIH